ncbi:MAG: hypothetical protein S4CHLAM81_10470 [Chlamydiales bacterium]|nr:hypothetical protein [Chlamydiales bacterium]MCH9635825.1 hypothetical protein [Chlamydiales bacterium]
MGKFATHALCVDNRADQIYEVPIERVAKDLKALFPDYTLAEGDVAVLYLEKEGNESVTFMRKLGGHFAFSS